MIFAKIFGGSKKNIYLCIAIEKSTIANLKKAWLLSSTE